MNIGNGASIAHSRVVAVKVDPLILPVREKGPKRAFFAGLINCSKTRMDKNQTKTPTRAGKIRQQKSRLLKSGFLNGRGGGIPLRYFS